MPLRFRFLILLGLLFAGLLAGMVALHVYEREESSTILAKVRDQRTELTSQVLDLVGSNVEKFVYEYAQWTEAAEFVDAATLMKGGRRSISPRARRPMRPRWSGSSNRTEPSFMPGTRILFRKKPPPPKPSRASKPGRAAARKKESSFGADKPDSVPPARAGFDCHFSHFRLTADLPRERGVRHTRD